MKLQTFTKYRNLFTTKSGVQVRQPLPVLPKENVLVRFTRTGQIFLNNRNITETVYRKLLHTIQYYHPDAWVRGDAHQIIIIYPKLVVE